jgi:hypothetical protein
MILNLKPFKIERGNTRRWHRRTVICRKITIGGCNTGERPRQVFVIFARLWARKSESHRRWLYLQNSPQKSGEAERFFAYRIRILPQQLASARRKVAALEREAARLDMHDLLEGAAAKQGTVQ